MPHRHILAQLALFASYLIIVRFVADVAAGGWPDSVAVRGTKQAIS
jgi:hypothetical protein